MKEQAAQASSAGTDTKVRVRFKAVGNAPRMKKNKFYIGANETFAVLKSFLRRQLKLGSDAQLFLYCNSSFAPGLDQDIGTLYSCFKERTTNDLIVDYGTTGAYG